MKISLLLERFFIQLIALEVLWSILHSPWHFDLKLFEKKEKLPAVFMTNVNIQPGWYLFGDCSQDASIKKIHSVLSDDVCLEGPFSRMYQVSQRLSVYKTLKYSVSTLYIH